MKIHHITGGLIALHGLIRIFSIAAYIEFVQQNFHGAVLGDTMMTIGSALLPFLEFFIGLLVICRIHMRNSLLFGLLISLIMAAFIVVGHLYPRLIYHVVAVALILATSYYECKNRALKQSPTQ